MKTNTRKTNTRKTNTRKTNTRKTNTRKTNTRKTRMKPLKRVKSRTRKQVYKHTNCTYRVQKKRQQHGGINPNINQDIRLVYNYKEGEPDIDEYDTLNKAMEVGLNSFDDFPEDIEGNYDDDIETWRNNVWRVFIGSEPINNNALKIKMKEYLPRIELYSGNKKLDQSSNIIS